MPGRVALRLATEESVSGRLLALEGCPGAGGAAQAAMLRDWLEVQGWPVLETVPTGEEPGWAAAGEDGYPLAGSLWRAAGLAEAVEHRIRPALEAGFVVLVHPYVHTLAAVCRTAGARRSWVERVFRFAPAAHTAYLRTAPAEGLRRVLARDGKLDRPGPGGAAQFLHRWERLQRVLDEAAGKYGFRTVDAGEPGQVVQEQLRRWAEELLVKG
ncbi:MAG: hypothetical protein M0031_12410 [Thermaerobacter sp.]|nr:hypothetical protein [Thermaerobacter sp.]